MVVGPWLEILDSNLLFAFGVTSWVWSVMKVFELVSWGSCAWGVMRSCAWGLIWWYFCPHVDGELAKQHSDPSPSPTTTSTGGSSTITTSTPSPYPLPADTSPTSGHAPRLKRPTFLPIKNHARPATDKQGGKGDERVHDTPFSRSTSQKAPSSSSSYASLHRLPISMYQLPAGAMLYSPSHIPGLICLSPNVSFKKVTFTGHHFIPTFSIVVFMSHFP